jgi:hypothetical protein
MHARPGWEGEDRQRLRVCKVQKEVERVSWLGWRGVRERKGVFIKNYMARSDDPMGSKVKTAVTTVRRWITEEDTCC